MLHLREPNIEAITKLATIFNVSIDYYAYYNSKSKLKTFKKIYQNATSVAIDGNEICACAGDFSYGCNNSTSDISMFKIESLLDNIQNSHKPVPQVMIQLKI